MDAPSPTVEAGLAGAFPDSEIDSIDAAGPSWNDENETVRVTFTDGAVAYCKVATDGTGERIRRERAVVDFVAERTAVPVPEVLAADPDGDPPYLATAPVDSDTAAADAALFIEGLGEADRADVCDRYRAFGAGLARVHALEFDHPGTVIGGGADGLVVEDAPWHRVLLDYVAWLREVSPDDRYDGHFDRVAAAVEANRDRLDRAPASLLHGDPSRPNVFLLRAEADGEGAYRAGFLDWEQAVVGDPVRELVRVREQQLGPTRGDADEVLLSAFHEGYRGVAGGLPEGYEERRPVYEAVRLLGVSGYFERTVEFENEDEEAFAAWLEAEMDRRLAGL